MRLFAPMPQLLRNVRFEGGGPLQDALENATVQAAIRDAEAELGTAGRLLIRKSGTEPLIRVMAEGEDEAQVGRIVDQLVTTIGAAPGAASDAA